MNSRTETQHEEENERGDGTPYCDELDEQIHIDVTTEDIQWLTEMADEEFTEMRLRVHNDRLEFRQVDACKAMIVHATIPHNRQGPDTVVDFAVGVDDLHSAIAEKMPYCDTVLTINPEGTLDIQNGHQWESSDITQMEAYHENTIQILDKDRLLPDVRWPPESEPGDFATTVTMPVQRFVGAFRGISAAAGFRVRLTTNGDELIFEGRDHTDKDPIEYPFRWSFPAEIGGPDVSTTYSTSFTRFISEYLSTYEDTRIRFGDAYPIEIAQESRRFILAPQNTGEKQEEADNR